MRSVIQGRRLAIRGLGEPMLDVEGVILVVLRKVDIVARAVDAGEVYADRHVSYLRARWAP